MARFPIITRREGLRLFFPSDVTVRPRLNRRGRRGVSMEMATPYGPKSVFAIFGLVFTVSLVIMRGFRYNRSG